MNIDAKKVMESSKVSHGKFRSEQGSDGSEKGDSIGSEDDIIDI
jgi:hypothetical protein